MGLLTLRHNAFVFVDEFPNGEQILSPEMQVVR